MNTNFIDIAATVSNLVQSGFHASGAGGADPVSGMGQGFEERFQQEISRIETAAEAGKRTVASAEGHVREHRDAANVSDARTAVEDTGGEEFLSKFEAVLNQISNGDLKGTKVDSQGLDALRMLLVKAGFDPDKVDSLMADLKKKSEKEDISLEDLLTAISEFVVEVDEKATPEVVTIETSSLPFIKTLLGELGLTGEEISGIVDGADRGDGINLDLLIENLKAVQAGYEEGGKIPAVNDSDGSFKTLMASLNLKGSESLGETITIKDLIRSFEAYKSAKEAVMSAALAENSEVSATGATRGISSESISSLLNSFVQSLSTGSERQASSFSYQEIKDQFINEMMIPGKTGEEKNGLFASQEMMTDGKTDQLAKELASLLGQKSGTSSESKIVSAESTGKELRQDLSKAEAVLSGGGSAGSDIESSGTPARAKAAPRTLPAYVTNQVGRGIVRAVNQGDSTLRLQLKPAELGRLTMTIDHQSTGVKVTIVTENQAARDLLASNVNELKSALSSAGISLDSFDVDMNSDFKQSMANAGNQAGQFGRRNGSRQGGGFSARGSQSVDEVLPASELPVIDGSYHFVA